MAPVPDDLSDPGAASYSSDTMTVGDGTWDFGKNSFLMPNLAAPNYETMRYNGGLYVQLVSTGGMGGE